MAKKKITFKTVKQESAPLENETANKHQAMIIEDSPKLTSKGSSNRVWPMYMRGFFFSTGK